MTCADAQCTTDQIPATLQVTVGERHWMVCDGCAYVVAQRYGDLAKFHA
jgi:hypothetical protein